MKVFLKIAVSIVSAIGVSFMTYSLWTVHKEEGLCNVFMEGYNEEKARTEVTSEE